MARHQLISTMAQPLMVYGGKFIFEAIDPDTGATVSGVKITNPVVAGVNLSSDGSTDQGPVGPYLYVPGPES